MLIHSSGCCTGCENPVEICYALDPLEPCDLTVTLGTITISTLWSATLETPCGGGCNVGATERGYSVVIPVTNLTKPIDANNKGYCGCGTATVTLDETLDLRSDFGDCLSPYGTGNCNAAICDSITNQVITSVPFCATIICVPLADFALATVGCRVAPTGSHTQMFILNISVAKHQNQYSTVNYPTLVGCNEEETLTCDTESSCWGGHAAQFSWYAYGNASNCVNDTLTWRPYMWYTNHFKNNDCNRDTVQPTYDYGYCYSNAGTLNPNEGGTYYTLGGFTAGQTGCLNWSYFLNTTVALGANYNLCYYIINSPATIFTNTFDAAKTIFGYNYAGAHTAVSIT